ncbi:hypothetical protein [Phenylobacterium montanum]|uniref:Uncharacterized protein n=1 Tax=Phenylobacterium montanum TaxID=2823693 RepID=A0A975IVZ6_9CAUL|nr:hypothetical protein [Caulobacter sp. S6]QUD89069.1 hypothetical protein KCG34_04055 [Caulobacter sp. S6]
MNFMTISEGSVLAEKGYGLSSSDVGQLTMPPASPRPCAAWRAERLQADGETTEHF